MYLTRISHGWGILASLIRWLKTRKGLRMSVQLQKFLKINLWTWWGKGWQLTPICITQLHYHSPILVSFERLSPAFALWSCGIVASMIVFFFEKRQRDRHVGASERHQRTQSQRDLSLMNVNVHDWTWIKNVDRELILAINTVHECRRNKVGKKI